jgi:hypothetical protein
MENQYKPLSPASAGHGAPEPATVPDRSDKVQQQILDFLDGKTDGEELLHALHDHVLDEPIPERMLALFKQACSAEPELNWGTPRATFSASQA